MQIQDEDLPQWLKDAKANPPPPRDPQVIEAEERRQRVAEARAIRMRLPTFVATPEISTLIDRIPSEAFRSAAKSWNWGDGNLLLLGESDEGKTTAAALLCRLRLLDAVNHGGHAWTQAQGIRWVRAGRLVSAVHGWPHGRGECPEFVEAARASLLVIDELGWETNNKIIAELLACRFDSVDEDQPSRLSTIVTSGQTLLQLRGLYGDAVVKRMVKNGNKPAIIVRSFPKADEEEAKRKAAELASKPRPPSDQAQLAARQGETL